MTDSVNVVLKPAQIDDSTPIVSPQFEVGTEVKVDKKVSDLGKAKIVGREWGCKNQGDTISVRYRGWIYLLSEQKPWHKGVINKRWYASEEEVLKWQTL